MNPSLFSLLYAMGRVLEKGAVDEKKTLLSDKENEGEQGERIRERNAVLLFCLSGERDLEIQLSKRSSHSLVDSQTGGVDVSLLPVDSSCTYTSKPLCLSPPFPSEEGLDSTSMRKQSFWIANSLVFLSASCPSRETTE